MIRRARTGFLEGFLITAVLTVLGLRVYLAAAHYPQLGGNGLHIAHVLWGGLAMAIAIGILLALLTWRAHWVAAAVGGAGLGLFIDELGKFLTSDNNYFFKPAPALIYVVFGRKGLLPAAAAWRCWQRRTQASRWCLFCAGSSRRPRSWPSRHAWTRRCSGCA